MLIFCLVKTERERGCGFLKIVFLTKKVQKMSIFFFRFIIKIFDYQNWCSFFWQMGQFLGLEGGSGRRFENCLEKTKNEHYLFCTHSLTFKKYPFWKETPFPSWKNIRKNKRHTTEKTLYTKKYALPQWPRRVVRLAKIHSTKRFSSSFCRAAVKPWGELTGLYNSTPFDACQLYTRSLVGKKLKQRLFFFCWGPKNRIYTKNWQTKKSGKNRQFFFICVILQNKKNVIILLWNGETKANNIILLMN